MDLGIAADARAAVAAASQGSGFGVAAGARRAKACRSRSAAATPTRSRRPRRRSGRRVPIVADVCDRRRRGRVRRATRASALGGIDILVANAGGPPPGNFAASPTVEPYARRVRAQLPLDDRDVLRGACPRCARSGGAGCVAITSIAVRQPIPTLILSNTARAGVTGFLKTLAPRGRGRRRDRELAAARAARDRAHRARCTAATRRASPRRSPPGASATPTTSARSPRSCARSRPGSSPAPPIPVDGGVVRGAL